MTNYTSWASTTEIVTSIGALGAKAQDPLSYLVLNANEIFERTLDRLPDVASKVRPSPFLPRVYCLGLHSRLTKCTARGRLLCP